MDITQGTRGRKERWYCIKRPATETDPFDESLINSDSDSYDVDDHDVSLVAEDGSVFPANQKLLIANSLYFQKFLNHLKERKEVTFVLKDIQPRTLSLLLEYIGKGTVMIESSQVKAFVEAATSLQLRGIVADFQVDEKIKLEKKRRWRRCSESLIRNKYEDKAVSVPSPSQSTSSQLSSDSDVQFIRIESISSQTQANRYKNYNESQIQKALKEVLSGKLKCHSAGKKYGVPSRTLYHRIKAKEKTQSQSGSFDDNNRGSFIQK